MLKRIFILIILSSLLLSCSAAKIREGETSKEYFERGQEHFDKEKYKTAIKIFDNILDEFPYSRFTILAQLRKGEAYYLKKEYLEALPILESFLIIHPKHEEIDKVYYLIAMCYFEQLSSKDRDQTYTFNAISYFRRLIRLFPDSIYVEDANKKILACRNLLAEHELYVGKFYLRTKKLDAAEIRFLNIEQNYNDSEIFPNSIFYLGKTYLKMKKEEKAVATFLRFKDTYPDHKYAGKAEKIINEINSNDPAQDSDKM